MRREAKREKRKVEITLALRNSLAYYRHPATPPLWSRLPCLYRPHHHPQHGMPLPLEKIDNRVEKTHMISTNIKRNSFLYMAPSLVCSSTSIFLKLPIKDLNSIKENICIYIILQACYPYHTARICENLSTPKHAYTYHQTDSRLSVSTVNEDFKPTI